NALRRLPGKRAPKDERVETAEEDWVLAELERSPPDLAILVLGACTFAKPIRASGTRVLALKALFTDRIIRLGEKMTSPMVCPDLIKALGHAEAVGFNNLHDLDLYERLSRRGNGVFVGMGYATRILPQSDLGPTILYVGARTKPNIES